MNAQPLKNMSLYALSLILIKGVSLLTLPLVAHYLSPSEVGHLELLGITTMFFSLIVGISMHENLYRFIGTIRSNAVKWSQASQLYYASLLLSVLLSALLIVLYRVVPFDTGAITPQQWLLMALVLCFEAPLAIALAWVRLQNQASLFCKISVATVFTQVGLLILVLTHQPDVTLIFTLNVLCSFTQFLFLHFYLGFRLSLPNPKRISRYIRYSAPLMLSALVAFGLAGAERWLIAAITDMATLGMYAIAAKFALGVGILIQPFHMWWMPKRFEAMKNLGAEYVVHATTQGIVVLCILSVTVTWLSQIFIALALPDAYQPATRLVGLTIIMMLFKEMVELTNFGILYQKQTARLLSINLISTGFAFSLCFVLRNIGIEAVLIGLIAGQLCRCILTLLSSQKAYFLPFSMVQIFTLICLTCVFVLTSRYQQSHDILLLMLLLQPVGLLALAMRLRLLPSLWLKQLASTVSHYVGKAP